MEEFILNLLKNHTPHYSDIQNRYENSIIYRNFKSVDYPSICEVRILWANDRLFSGNGSKTCEIVIKKDNKINRTDPTQISRYGFTPKHHEYHYTTETIKVHLDHISASIFKEAHERYMINERVKRYKALQERQIKEKELFKKALENTCID